MVWSLDYEDFNGNCAGEKWPIVSAIREQLSGYTEISVSQPGSIPPKDPWSSFRGRMLKASPLISSDLHLLITKCNCWTHDVNIGLKLKNLSFVILGAYNMFDKQVLNVIDPRFVRNT